MSPAARKGLRLALIFAGLLALSAYVFILNRAYERAMDRIAGEVDARVELSSKVDALAESEREARAEQVRLLSDRTSKLEDRNADLLAWIVTTREKMLTSGFQAPPLPTSLESEADRDP